MKTAKYTDEERRQKAFESKERYYSPTRYAKRGWTIWTDEEIGLIMSKVYTDRELAEMLERSTMAIQVKRSLVNKRRRDAENLSRI